MRMILFGNRTAFHIPHGKQARHGKHITTDRFPFPLHVAVIGTSQQADRKVGDILIEISDEVCIQLRLLLIILAEPSVGIGRIANIMLVGLRIIIIVSQTSFELQKFERFIE